MEVNRTVPVDFPDQSYVNATVVTSLSDKNLQPDSLQDAAYPQHQGNSGLGA